MAAADSRLHLAIALLLVALALRTAALGVPPHTPTPISRIAYGSCNKVELPQPIWNAVRAWRPDLWIWLGDNVYNDRPRFLPVLFNPSSIAEMEKNYDAQKRVPVYSSLRHELPIIGTWDDHDYGVNDGDASFKDKKASKELLLNFLDEHRDSPRRLYEGVYGAWTFGEPPRQIKIILTDTRYFKNETQLLGEEQWRWLEYELNSSQAQVNIIGSSIQVLGLEKPFEKWGSYPQEFERLMRTLAASKANGVVLISGDVHYAQAYVLSPPCSPLGYPLHEFGSSGLTHSCDDLPLNLCALSAKYLLDSRFHNGPMVTEKNFGTLTVDWDAGTLTAQVHNVTGHVLVEHVLSLAALQYDESKVNVTEGCWPCASFLGWRQLPPLVLAKRLALSLVAVLCVACALVFGRVRHRFRRGAAAHPPVNLRTETTEKSEMVRKKVE